MNAAWHQFLAIVECPDCHPATGRTWTKDDVVVAAEPCEKHLRMLDRQGWVS